MTGMKYPRVEPGIIILWSQGRDFNVETLKLNYGYWKAMVHIIETWM